jgi:hypothetical protein
MFSKYWYVVSKGKTTASCQNNQKVLQGAANIKNVAQIEGAQAFMEGIGWSEPSTVGVENANLEKVAQMVSKLKKTYLSTSDPDAQHMCMRRFVYVSWHIYMIEKHGGMGVQNSLEVWGP